MNKLIFILLVLYTLLLPFSFGQSNNTNEIKICNETVSFSSSLTINQKRQTIKGATFEMMYVYIKHVTDMEGFYLSTGTNGKRSYITNYSTDTIIKQGLTNNPFKEYEIMSTPTEFVVLEELFKGSIIEKKEKGTETISHYLIACGKICGEDIGFEVKLNNKQVDNNSLSNELKKILMFKEK